MAAAAELHAGAAAVAAAAAGTALLGLLIGVLLGPAAGGATGATTGALLGLGTGDLKLQQFACWSRPLLGPGGGHARRLEASTTPAGCFGR